MNQPASLIVRVSLKLGSFDLDVDFQTTTRVTGVFGASGAGKTSLLEAIAGLRRRATGLIRLDDEVWLDSEGGICLRPEHRHIGYVPQEGLLFPHKNVRENLLAGSARASRDGRAPGKTLKDVCDLLELTPLLQRGVATLSGGEVKRVALGRAILSGPRLMLLDEPLASVDIPLRRRVLPFLRRVRDEFRIPMILVSHDPTEVQALCDDLIALRDGAVIARGSPRDVLMDPKVFPLAEQEGFENVLPCSLIRTEGEMSEVRLGTRDGGVRLVIPRTEGDVMMVGIPAREIIIATQKPAGVSAQNVLPARIVAVRSVGDLHLATASIAEGIPHLAAEVTARACSDLDLQPGRSVFLIIKAAGCVLYGRRGP